MAEFENPTFDPDGPGIDDDALPLALALDLPDPVMDSSLDLQQELNTSGDRIQSMRDEFRQTELEAQKKRLVDTFYREVNFAYGLRPEGRIDYDQFEIDADGKTFYWVPGDKKIPISATRGRFRFLGLSTLAGRYGVGGTDALRRLLGLIDYIAGTSRKGLSSSTVKTLRQADEALDASFGNIQSIELVDLPGVAYSARLSTEQVETTLTTLVGQPIDTVLVTRPEGSLLGLKGLWLEPETSLRITSDSSRTSMAGNPMSKNTWPGSIKN